MLSFIVFALCVFAFAVCVLAALAILLLQIFTDWQPKNAELRDWLIKSVLFIVVSAVVGFAVYAFQKGTIAETYQEIVDEPLPTVSVPPPSPGTPSPTSTIRAPAPPTADSTASPVTVSCELPHPATLRDWGDAELGTRPDFRCASRTSYPPCLAVLQSRGTGETSTTEAQECGHSIAEFRRTTTTPLLSVKGGYQANLSNAETTLRGTLTPVDEARRDYVLSEMSRLNGTEWERFNEIDNGSLADMRACFSDTRCESTQ